MHHNLTKGFMQVAPYHWKLELRMRTQIKVACMFQRFQPERIEFCSLYNVHIQLWNIFVATSVYNISWSSSTYAKCATTIQIVTLCFNCIHLHTINILWKLHVFFRYLRFFVINWQINLCNFNHKIKFVCICYNEYLNTIHGTFQSIYCIDHIICRIGI